MISYFIDLHKQDPDRTVEEEDILLSCFTGCAKGRSLRRKVASVTVSAEVELQKTVKRFEIRWPATATGVLYIAVESRPSP